MKEHYKKANFDVKSFCYNFEKLLVYLSSLVKGTKGKEIEVKKNMPLIKKDCENKIKQKLQNHFLTHKKKHRFAVSSKHEN